jgi:hypothetical protein
VDNYREQVRRIASRRDGEAVFNASDEHAAIVVEEIFRTAQRQVSILTGHLAPRIFARDRLLSWSEIFLSDPEHRLRILAREGEIDKLGPNPAYEQLQGYPNVEVRALPDSLEAEIAFRFITADDDIYRFEPDKNKCAAVAAFGDSKVAQHLQEVFDTLWEVSAMVDRKTLKVMPSLQYEEETQP